MEPSGAGPPRVEVVWALVPAGRLDDAARAALAADVDDARLARLDRFHRQQDRDLGLAAHALLRRELAARVGGVPARLRLPTRCAACGSTEHGKPYLPGAPLEFNLSHSGELVCLALAPAGVPVGVDVEQRRPVDWAALRRSVFTDAEWELTGRATDPDAARTLAWARKEAAVKASGHGLAVPLRRVDVVPGRPWRVDAVAGLSRSAAVAGWDLALDGAPPHGAAVAALLAPGSPEGPGEPPGWDPATFEPVLRRASLG